MVITAIFISIKHRFLNLRQLVIYLFISFVLEAIDINIIKSENELALDGKKYDKSSKFLIDVIYIWFKQLDL